MTDDQRLRRLIGETVGDFVVGNWLGAGASGVVFRANSNSDKKEYALKFYDPVFVQRIGRDEIKARLERQLELKEHDCPYIAKIYSGGEGGTCEGNLFYLVMELVEGDDFRDWVNKSRKSDQEIRIALGQLHAAVTFLLSKNRAHRDIKPENIRVRCDGTIAVLDLGVLKHINDSDLTDDLASQRPFLGTLRYAPPEFLRREETDTQEGWAAVCAYQVGTVLYEMIEGIKIFDGVKGAYAKLVEAVLFEQPILNRSDVGRDLVRLAKGLLIKDPIERLHVSPWNAIKEVAATTSQRSSVSTLPEIDARVRMAREQHIREILSRQRRIETAKKMQEQVFNQTAQCITNTAAVFSTYRELGATVGGVDGSDIKWITVLYPANLANGLVYDLVLWVRIRKVDVKAESTLVRGIGFYSTVRQKRSKATGQDVVTTPQVENYFETIYAGVFDEEALKAEISSWAESMLARFLEETGEIFQVAFNDEKNRLEATEKGIKHVARLNDTNPLRRVFNSKEFWTA